MRIFQGKVGISRAHSIGKKVLKLIQRRLKPFKKWPIPTNITETQSFLGLCNYYCKFIKDYAKIAKPLYKLISGENAKKKNNEIEWTSEC